jgi:starch synthase
MNVLFASAEIFPLAKTGGLADVSASLPEALGKLGADIRLIMPAYPEALDRAEHKRTPISLGEIIGYETILIPARTPGSGLPLLLVDCPALFRRPGGPYADAERRNWPDNAIRFALFSHAVARVALETAGDQCRPDVVHLNDWHLGLVPGLLAARPAARPATVLTIHNLAFQGVFPAEVFAQIGLSGSPLGLNDLEFYGRVSFLKGGIRFADRLTTVSPSYARETLTPEFGCGLDGLLRTRSDDLEGILNGIDCGQWSPEDPERVPFPYSASDMSGKRKCKAELQRELGLIVDTGVPLIVFLSRLTHQKMADLLPQIIPDIANQGLQLAVCGEGDRSIEKALPGFGVQFPRQIAVRIGYEESLARRMLAGGDILVAPARFEPCGLTQMYAMRFGTLPIVRRVGGLADTVTGRDSHGAAARKDPTGFVFEEATPEALLQAIDQATRTYREPLVWRAMQRHAMRQDFGWRGSAERYLEIYAELVGAGATSARSLEEEIEFLPTGT